MKSFKEFFKQDRKILSLEFFPPKKNSGLAETEKLISSLSYYSPDFITITYGAGGGTRDFSKRLVSYIANTLDITAVAHLTCVGHSKDEIKNILSSFKEEGVSHILALRGDPPKGDSSFKPHPNGFTSAKEITSFIKQQKDFSIAVAGYPEVHIEAKSPEDDLIYLKSKVDSGAELIITQLFFDPSLYFSFVNKARAIGINTPILPGVMPIQNVSQLERFTNMCGASIPSTLHKKLKEIESCPEEVIKFGTLFAITQIIELLEGGAPGVHLYTLNKSQQIIPIIEAIKPYLEVSSVKELSNDFEIHPPLPIKQENSTA